MPSRLIALIVAAIVALSAALAAAAHAEEAFPLSELTFASIFAARKGGDAVYCLLGSGFFRAPRSGAEDSIIKAFAAAHPNAQVVPVTVTTPGPPHRMIYAWVEDGADNLNATLVRDGAFPGGVMIDVVGQSWTTGLAAEDKPYRMVSDERYRAFLERVRAAERAAKDEKKGIWSDEFQKRTGGDQLN